MVHYQLIKEQELLYFKWEENKINNKQQTIPLVNSELWCNTTTLFLNFNLTFYIMLVGYPDGSVGTNGTDFDRK